MKWASGPSAEDLNMVLTLTVQKPDFIFVDGVLYSI